MIELTVTTVDLAPTPAVVSARRVSRSNLGDEVAAGIRKVRAAVTAARVPTAGPPFVRYLTRDEEPEIEIGLPLDGSHAVPTLRATILPAGTAAVTWHVGPYEKLFVTLAELEEWVVTNGHPGGDPWVWHLTEPDAEQASIQVVWPMRSP